MSKKALYAVLLLASFAVASADQDGPRNPPPQQQRDQPSKADAQPAPAAAKQSTPSSFEPSEKISADSAISFPVDI